VPSCRHATQGRGHFRDEAAPDALRRQGQREDPFRSADRREIEATVKRIAAAGETFAIAGWREEAGFLLFHFPTWAKARAMQHWIDRSAIAHRPMLTPYIGPQLGVGNGAPTAMPPPAPQRSEMIRP